MTDEIKVLAQTTTRGKIFLSIHSEHGNDFIQITGFQRGGKKWISLSCANWGAMIEAEVDEHTEELFKRLIESADSNAEG